MYDLLDIMTTKRIFVTVIQLYLNLIMRHTTQNKLSLLYCKLDQVHKQVRSKSVLYLTFSTIFSELKGISYRNNGESP